MEIVRIRKQPSSEERLLAISEGETKYFDLKSGTTARYAISRMKKSRDYHYVRFETWTDTVDGEDVIAIKRKEDVMEDTNG